jgi:hypothetical protein
MRSSFPAEPDEGCGFQGSGMVPSLNRPAQRLSMKKLLGLATLPFLAAVAMAGQPSVLSDAQMDKVTAGAYGLEFGNVIELTFNPMSPPATANPVIQVGPDDTSGGHPNFTIGAPPTFEQGNFQIEFFNTGRRGTS